MDTIDFARGDDTGEADKDAVAPLKNGDEADKDSFNRPIEALRNRTEVLRAEVNENRWVRDADRSFVAWLEDGATLTWNGTSDDGGDGQLSLSGDALIIAPTIGPGEPRGDSDKEFNGTRYASRRAWVEIDHEDSSESNPMRVVARKFQFEGANEITIEIVGEADYGTAVSVSVSGDGTVDDPSLQPGLDNIKITYDADAPPTWASVAQAVDNDPVAGSLVYITTPSGSDDQEPVYDVEKTRLSGGFDGVFHQIDPSVVSGWSGELKEGDTLAIWYDTTTLRRESIEENDNKHLVTTSNLVNLSESPDKAAHAVPVGRVMGGNFVLATGKPLIRNEEYSSLARTHARQIDVHDEDWVSLGSADDAQEAFDNVDSEVDTLQEDVGTLQNDVSTLQTEVDDHGDQLEDHDDNLDYLNNIWGARGPMHMVPHPWELDDLEDPPEFHFLDEDDPRPVAGVIRNEKYTDEQARAVAGNGAYYAYLVEDTVYVGTVDGVDQWNYQLNSAIRTIDMDNHHFVYGTDDSGSDTVIEVYDLEYVDTFSESDQVTLDPDHSVRKVLAAGDRIFALVYHTGDDEYHVVMYDKELNEMDSKSTQNLGIEVAIDIAFDGRLLWAVGEDGDDVWAGAFTVDESDFINEWEPGIIGDATVNCYVRGIAVNGQSAFAYGERLGAVPQSNDEAHVVQVTATESMSSDPNRIMATDEWELNDTTKIFDIALDHRYAFVAKHDRDDYLKVVAYSLDGWKTMVGFFVDDPVFDYPAGESLSGGNGDFHQGLYSDGARLHALYVAGTNRDDARFATYYLGRQQGLFRIACEAPTWGRLVSTSVL